VIWPKKEESFLRSLLPSPASCTLLYCISDRSCDWSFGERERERRKMRLSSSSGSVLPAQAASPEGTTSCFFLKFRVFCAPWLAH
jgi:hypothetical protein